MFNHSYNSRVSTVMCEVNLIQQGLINKTIDSIVIVIKFFFYKTSTTVVVLEVHGYKKKIGGDDSRKNGHCPRDLDLLG